MDQNHNSCCKKSENFPVNYLASNWFSKNHYINYTNDQLRKLKKKKRLKSFPGTETMDQIIDQYLKEENLHKLSRKYIQNLFLNLEQWTNSFLWIS